VNEKASLRARFFLIKVVMPELISYISPVGMSAPT
jgi:hypothetical protein